MAFSSSAANVSPLTLRLGLTETRARVAYRLHHLYGLGGGAQAGGCQLRNPGLKAGAIGYYCKIHRVPKTL